MEFCDVVDVSTGVVSVDGKHSFLFTDPKKLWTDLINFMGEYGYKCTGYDITHICYIKVKFSGYGDNDILFDCGYYWHRDEDPEKAARTFCYMVEHLTELPVGGGKDKIAEVEIPNPPWGSAFRAIRLLNVRAIDSRRRFFDCLKKWLVRIGYVGG